MDFETTPQKAPAHEPLIIPRAEHPISRKKITPEALKVLYGLYRAGFKAYLVGGSVRDMLLKREPKDFDVATDARPQQVKRLFRNARIIGRRFRVVHVRFSQDNIVEVSTFRSTPSEEENELIPQPRLSDAEDATDEESEFENGTEESGDNGLLRQRINENTFGTEAEDALRRDLTINGLFYDIATFSVIDYVGGLRDLHEGLIRTIGDPDVRFVEDPVRIIRAIRHAARTGFTIEPQTLAAIEKHHHLLRTCSPARVFEEILRELRGGYSYDSFGLMMRTTCLKTLFPPIAGHLGKIPAGEPHPGDDWYRLQILDRLRAERGPIQDSILLANLMVPLLSELIAEASSPEKSRADNARLTDELRVRAEALAMELSFPRRMAAASIGHIAGMCRIRRALAQGGLPTSMRAKSYFAEAFLLYELDAIARGETPADIEQLPATPAQRRTRKRRPRGRRRKGPGA